MIRSDAVVDRMRWMSALGLAALLALTVAVAMRSAAGISAPTPMLTAPPQRAAAPPAPTSGVLDPRIARLAARDPSRVVEAIVQFKSGVGAERARWAVARVGGRVFGALHIINALAVKLSAAAARRLATSPDVHAISLNSTIRTEGGPGGPAKGGPGAKGGPVGPGAAGKPGGPGIAGQPGTLSAANLQTTYDQTLKVTQMWQVGIIGASVGVAVIDTGIAGGVPDFQTADHRGSRVVETAVTNPLAQNAGDSYGHGTDVAGIIAGNGDDRSLSDPLYGRYIGVAPGSNLVSIKVSDEAGNATVLDVIYGLQFAVDHKSDYNIRVVNLSLDSTTPQSYKTDPLDAAAEAAWFHGIVVVAAAGNRGAAPDALHYAPANDPYVITVGATDEHGSSNAGNDTIAGWSSRGTTQDGFHKPDVYAPGAHIVSVLAPGSAFASMCPSCIVGGQYIDTGGTSMAAPMISGLVADLLQARPNLRPDEVKGMLMSSPSLNPSFQEVNGWRVLHLPSAPLANQGLTPNTLISSTSGNIDYSRSSWSRSSWSQATGALSASFARSSWSCDCGTMSSGSIDPTRSSWSRSSWSTYLGH
jgi:serine protease AprX